MGADNFKGLKIYLVAVLVGLAFFVYSQHIGWKWLGATKTQPPTDQQGGSGARYRYLHHK
jgi:hypothetical protein